MIRSNVKRLVRAEGSSGVVDAISLFRLWPTASFIADAECPEYLSVYSDLIEKPQTAAIGRVGRAYCFIQKGHYGSALADLAAVDSLHATKPLGAPTARFTNALRARANQGLSATAAVKRNSGISSAENVNSSRCDYVHSLRNAIRANVDDFTLHAAMGEEQIEVLPVEAILSLRAASETLDLDILRCKEAFHGFLSPSRCIAASLYANLWLNRMRQEDASLKGSALYKSIRNAKSTDPHKQSMEAYRNSTGMHDLSPAELDAVLSMDVAIIAQDHGFSRQCKADEVAFRNWDSEKAKCVETLMNQFSGNITSKNQSAIRAIEKKIDNIAASDSTSGFKAPNLKNMTMKKLAAKSSQSPTDPELVVGSKFMNLLNEIDEVYTGIPTTNVNSEEFRRKQKDLTLELLLQQRDRINVALGMAYGKTDQEQSGLRVLNEVVDRDSYLSMHRALEARAKILQSMGETARSEADFRELYRLKALSIDIPSLDANTQRRSF